MFEKVLVGIALSPATEALVSALPAMGELGTREFSLVHVAKPFHEPVSQSLTRLEKLRSRVGALADRLREDGFAVTIDVPTGAPAAAVLKVAESRDPDVVLIGSRSRSPIKDAFIGSVAWDIVRGVGRPVLLQRIDPIRAEPEEALETRGRGPPHARDISYGLLRHRCPSSSVGVGVGGGRRTGIHSHPCRAHSFGRAAARSRRPPRADRRRASRPRSHSGELPRSSRHAVRTDHGSRCYMGGRIGRDGNPWAWETSGGGAGSVSRRGPSSRVRSGSSGSRRYGSLRPAGLIRVPSSNFKIGRNDGTLGDVFLWLREPWTSAAQNGQARGVTSITTRKTTAVRGNPKRM